MSVLTPKDVLALYEDGFKDEAEAAEAEAKGLGARRPGTRSGNKRGDDGDADEKIQRNAKTISAYRETLTLSPNEAWDDLSAHIRRETGGRLKDETTRNEYAAWVHASLMADKRVAVNEIDPSQDFIVTPVAAYEEMSEVEHAPKMIKVIHKLSGVKLEGPDEKTAMKSINTALLAHLAYWSVCMEGEELTPESIAETVEPMTLVS